MSVLTKRLRSTAAEPRAAKAPRRADPLVLLLLRRAPPAALRATSAAAYVDTCVGLAARRGQHEVLFALEDALDGADAGERSPFLAWFDALTAEYRQRDVASDSIKSGLWRIFLALAQHIRPTPATLECLARGARRAPSADWSAWAHELLATLEPLR